MQFALGPATWVNRIKAYPTPFHQGIQYVSCKEGETLPHKLLAFLHESGVAIMTGQAVKGTHHTKQNTYRPDPGRSLTQKKKVVPEPGIFKRARGQYMPSPRCSQLFNHESLAPNLCKHTTM